MSTRLARVAPTAVRQHGLFTLTQAHAVGLSRGAIDRRVRSGELVIVDERVYRSALTPPTWHQRVLAACLAGPAVASHRSSGALWRLPGLEPPVVEVTALRHRRRKATDVIWHESYLLTEHEVTELEGIPVTTATRTILDLAGVVDDVDLLLRMFDDLVRRRLTSVPRARDALERLGPRRPGYRRALAVLDRRTERGAGQPVGARPRLPSVVPESDLETVFENLVRSAGLPVPDRQHTVRTPDGRTFRLDFAYPHLRVGVELLGATFHSTPERWATDVERLAVLAAMDWHMLVFGNDQVRASPAAVIDAVRSARARTGATSS